MPPTQDMIDDAIQALARVSLQSFTATPSTLSPFQNSTLDWVVDGVSQGVRITLNPFGTQVPATGSRVVAPLTTTSYSLTASMHTVQVHLGTVTVNVEAGACVDGLLPAEELQTQIRAEIDNTVGIGEVEEVFGVEIEITRRHPAECVVDASGINLKIFLNLGIPNFPDADLDIDARVILHAQDGQAVFTYTKFDTDVDFPWWAWLSGAVFGTLGVTILVLLEALINSKVRPKVQDRLDTKIHEQLELMILLLQATNPNHRLFALAHSNAGVEFTVCPVDEGVDNFAKPIRLDVPVGMSLPFSDKC